MKALLDNEWDDALLDHHLGEDQVRIQVTHWAALGEVQDQYVQYSMGDWRVILNYLREIGPVSVVHKIISRLRERGRNRKWLSVGCGKILDSRSERYSTPGQTVAFLACNHPKCLDRIVIDACLVVPFDGVRSGSGRLEFFEAGSVGVSAEELESLAGWTSYSGLAVERALVERGVVRVAQAMASSKSPTRVLPVDDHRRTRERELGHAPPQRGSKRAALFGLGNYAKTVILPSLPDEIEVEAIHEIDPLQIGDPARWDCTVDTSGEMRDGEQYDVYLIAGYHHTHTPLALEALGRGAYAVVEKPICTTSEQLAQLEAVMAKHGQLFACFHKRYSELNEWALEDLGLPAGEPISYHCIVYEIPLPKRHWYNWPNSGSRITSNGCHWLDHFMFLNDYAPVRDCDAYRSAAGEMSVRVELENDAFFTMTLTDEGSSRLGVRDYVELQAGGTTAKLVDNCRYEAENRSRIVRRENVNRVDSYKRMYSQIGRQIVMGEAGDSLATLRSTQLMLDLEELVRSR